MSDLIQYALLACMAYFLGVYYYLAYKYAQGVRYHGIENALRVCRKCVLFIAYYPEKKPLSGRE